MPHLRAALLGLLLSACAGADDNPSTVKDLRVLGIRMEPPELMAESCSDQQVVLDVLAAPVRLTALVADPAGEGRELEYTLAACASLDDATCEEDRVELGRGVAPAGEWPLALTPGPGAARLEDGRPLAQRVLEEDAYRGLGGLRLPLVLEVRGGEEQLFAQKLMVYSCRRFPEMKANVQPELPGLLLEGEPWEEGVARELTGPGPFRLEPVDFHALEEDFVVPSYSLEPVHLKEKWELAWYTTLGTLSPNETGGVDLGGQAERHQVEWNPPRDAAPQEVRFWMTVRDGRGGLSWVMRAVRYTP